MEKGYKTIPYINVNTKTSINGETVWYKNKLKNLLLRIKHLVIKPKYKITDSIILDKKVSSRFYKKIKDDENN